MRLVLTGGWTPMPSGLQARVISVGDHRVDDGGNPVDRGGRIAWGALIEVRAKWISDWIPLDPDGLPPESFPRWREQEKARRGL